MKKECSSTKHNSLEMIYIDGDALQEIYFEHNCSSLVLVVWEGENVERERVKRSLTINGRGKGNLMF